MLYSVNPFKFLSLLCTYCFIEVTLSKSNSICYLSESVHRRHPLLKLLFKVPPFQVRRRRPPRADPVSSSSIISQTSPVPVLPGPSWKQPWLAWGRSRSTPFHLILHLLHPTTTSSPNQHHIPTKYTTPPNYFCPHSLTLFWNFWCHYIMLNIPYIYTL